MNQQPRTLTAEEIDLLAKQAGERARWEAQRANDWLALLERQKAEFAALRPTPPERAG